MKNIFAVPLVTFSSYGWAQQLSAIAPPSDSTFGWFIVGVVALVGGAIYLKAKRPETFSRILGLATKAEKEAADEYRKLAAKHGGVTMHGAVELPIAATVNAGDVHPLDAKIAELKAQIAALQPPQRDPREDQIAELEAQLAALKPAAPPPPSPEDVAAIQAHLDAFRVRFPGYDVNGKQSAPPPIGGGHAFE